MERFAAKQLDGTMSDPTSTQLIAFLHRQRDLLAEHRGVAKGATKQERLLLVSNKTTSGSDDNYSSDDKTGSATKSTLVLAIYGRPSYPRSGRGPPTYKRTCEICSPVNLHGNCAG